jgi:predicted enzyme related to lactoylglutathione lyase
MKPKEIAFVFYPVTDVKRSKEFYMKAFDLKETANWENQWVEFDIGAGTFAIASGHPTAKPGSGGIVAFEVDDIHKCIEDLKRKGITLASGPHDSPVCISAAILDPDGNEVFVHQRKQK